MVRVVAQRADWDCGIASIAMFLDMKYEDVMDVVVTTIHDSRLKQRGLILHQMETVLAKLGVPTSRVYKKAGYLDGADAIIGFNGGLCAPHGHWAVLRHGMVFDPSGGEVWPLYEYIESASTSEEKCRPATLLVRQPS